MQVIVEFHVQQKLKNLVTILYDEGYFGLHENALAYVNAIYDFIYTVPKRTLRMTSNIESGTYYCHYKPNRRTTWYILFDIENEDYLIRNVFNNHSPEYPQFISGLK